MTPVEQKIAAVILHQPMQVTEWTITNLAAQAQVSQASISRFCHNLKLAGFHALKIELAKIVGVNSNLEKNEPTSVTNFLTQVSQGKSAEIQQTLANFANEQINQVLERLLNCRILQVAGQGNTFPVAADAVYRFNQLGIMAITSAISETALAQTLNLTDQDVLLVISNSGESKQILKQEKIAKQRGLTIIAITNRNDSPISLAADFRLKTAARPPLLQSTYYYSRLAAMTVIEALFLLMIAKQTARSKKIKQHEELIADTKV